MLVKRRKKIVWQILSLMLLFFIFFISYNIYKERNKNLLYYKEINNFAKNLNNAKLENLNLMGKINYLKHPLNREKEVKDKMGGILPGEKVIIISQDLLEHTLIPIFIRD